MMNDRNPDVDTARKQTIRDEARETDTSQPAADIRDTSEMHDDTEDSFLPAQQMGALRAEWSDVQASFVDDPRSAVQKAHELVTQVVNELTGTFTRERSSLESQWSGGGQADTEALRVALQRYRSFLNRLLGTSPSR